MSDDSKNVGLPTAGGNDTPALPAVVDRATDDLNARAWT
jgi:hypothetical protein